MDLITRSICRLITAQGENKMRRRDSAFQSDSAAVCMPGDIRMYFFVSGKQTNAKRVYCMRRSIKRKLLAQLLLA